MALTFRGGIHPDDRKDATKKKPIENLAPPETVVIPMSMHIGAPCTPTVSVGDTVKIGTVIGDSSAPLSAPIHASVSGTVTAVEPRLHPNGSRVMSVVIANDYENTIDQSVCPKGSFESLSPEDIISIVRNAGIVGLGGAGFPTHVKISSGLGKVDTLIINCAECEPYITSNYRAMIETPEEIIGGIRILMKAFGLSSAVIGIESNKLDAIPSLEKALPSGGGGIKIKTLKTKYPQGGEKQLIYSLTKREVPPGGLPAAVGCAVFNPDTCAAIYQAVTTGMPLVSRVVTVSGSAIANPKNLRCPVGTMVSDLVTACGGFKEEPYKIIAGGPMMGSALQGVDLPIIKSSNSILSFCGNEDTSVAEPQCIRCGRCVSVCPMNLMPIYIRMYYEKERYDELEKLNVSDCIECGSCAYVCPGRLFLTQTCRVAKARLAEYKKKGAN